MSQHQKIIETIFASQGANGCWKMLNESNRNYPVCLHYSPTFKSTLWTLILLADLEHNDRLCKHIGRYCPQYQTDSKFVQFF